MKNSANDSETATLDTGNAYSPPNCLRVTGPVDILKSDWQTSAVKPGESFYVEAYVRADSIDVTKHIQCLIIYWNGNFSTPYTDVTKTGDAIASTTDWQVVRSKPFTVPAGASRMQAFYCHTTAAGFTWFIDNCGLFRAVNSPAIIDGAVLSAAIADSAVTTQKLVDLAVGTNKLADAAVNNLKIGNAAVQNAHLDRATAYKVQIVDADIVNLRASAVNAGSFTGCSLSLTLNNVLTDITNQNIGGYISGVRVKKTTDETAWMMAPNRLFAYRPDGNLMIDLATYSPTTGAIVVLYGSNTRGEATSAAIQLVAGNTPFNGKGYVNIFDLGGGAAYQIGGQDVVKARYGTRPATLTDVINLLVYHGLSA